MSTTNILDAPIIEVQRAWKTECVLSREQQRQARAWFSAVQLVWNRALMWRTGAWNVGARHVSRFEQSRALTELKRHPEYAWLNQTPRATLDKALEHLDLAFKHFFRRCKQGETPGYPRLKSDDDDVRSLTFRQSIVVTKRAVRLPRLGWIKLKERGYLPPLRGADANTATLSFEAGKWFISVQAEGEVFQQPAPDRACRIWFELPDRMVIAPDDETPRTLRSTGHRAIEERRLRRLARRVTRRQDGSRRRDKARLRWQIANARIRWRRADDLHNLTSRLTSEYRSLTVEPRPRLKDEFLNALPRLRGDAREREKAVHRALADAGWGEFLRQLAYKTHWRGGTYTESGAE